MNGVDELYIDRGGGGSVSVLLPDHVTSATSRALMRSFFVSLETVTQM